MQITFSILTVLFIVVSIALVLIVLVQRPQGGGLSGAFGGGGGTDTAFGGRTGDALTVATITAFAIYLLIAIALNITGNVMNRQAADTSANKTNETASTKAPDTGATQSPEGAVKPIQLTPEQAKALLGDKPMPASGSGVPVNPANLPATAPAPAPATEPTPAPAPTPTPAPAPGGV
jgi:preprotein translocase subunit SecG